MRSLLQFFFPALFFCSYVGAQPASSYWSNFSSARNVSDLIRTGTKPLYYNDQMHAASFVQRNMPSYHPPTWPASSAPGIIGFVTRLVPSWWSSTYYWDSTCIWANSAELASHAIGGIYNPPGSYSDTSAYLVGMGACTSTANAWSGSWFAGKLLRNYTSSVNVGSGEMQFFPNTAATGSMGVIHLPGFFSATGDGRVHCIAEAGFNVATQGSLQKGAVVITGTFDAATGTFKWKSDSLMCPAVMGSQRRSMDPSARMAWNESGTVGYVVFIGARQGATGSNAGWQPIVFKTSDSGASWNLLPPIDFESQGAAPLKSRLPAVGNATQTGSPVIPFFDVYEGVDIIVDENDRLHIAALIYSSLSAHPDSLQTHTTFFNSVDMESYTWPHTPGKRPYLYDFIGDGTTTWFYGIVDSLSSERPGAHVNENGFGYNPWDIDMTDTSKTEVSARIQLSKTPQGRHILFTWAESDTTTTTGQVLWNISPNIKARLLDASTYRLSDTEISITSAPVQNYNVYGFAFMHCTASQSHFKDSTTNSIDIVLPVSVTNNSSLHHNEPVSNYFKFADLSFSKLMHAFTSTIGPVGTATPVAGIYEKTGGIAGLNLYPNPFTDRLQIDWNRSAQPLLDLSIQNMLGQEVYHAAIASPGEINLEGLPPGMYSFRFSSGASRKAVKVMRR